ncbi:MAG: glycoside hydrolase family 172 protein [Kiritimatiellales bacterium]
MKKTISLLAFILLCGCSQKTELPDGPVTFASRLSDLTNTLRLATGQSGTMLMSSSYDKTGGNADSRNFQGIDSDGNYILADLKGSGCLTRLWFTGIPDTTRINFYFDEESSPRLSVTVTEMKNGSRIPFIKPLCAEPSGAVISYVPLPYAKRLKVTASPDKEGFYYYQINYTALPPCTPVVSFFLPLNDRQMQQLTETCRIWEHTETLYTIDTKDVAAVTVPAGEETVLFSSNESGLIKEWALSVNDGNGDLPVQLPSRLVLKMYWDGDNKPSVHVPLSDFFCNPLRPREFTTALLARIDGTYHSRLPMPFRRGARITLTNQSKEPATVCFNALQTPLPKSSVYYFHSAWNQSMRRGRPFQLTQISGNGYFVGTSLLEYATIRPSWNILEGDEVFVIDRNVKNSFYGTGLEDYFNGGWYYSGGTYLMPLSGVVERSAIKTAQYRFHLDAPIRFKKQFAASFEFGDGNTSSGYFAGTAYWYQAKLAAVPNLPPVTARQRPKDPLEQQAFMCEIFETERRQNSQEAIALCREYAEKYPGTADAKIFLLRAVAYQAYLHPEQAAQLILDEPGMLSEQATLLKEFYADPKAALISAHVNGIYTLYLDGTPLLQGNNMTMQQTALTALPPGTHTLTMRVQWTKPDNWINVHLRTHTTNLWSDTTWECAQNPDTVEWNACVFRGFLPKMSCIRFEPNAMVYTQHHPLIGPQSGWDALGKTCWFRKIFEIRGVKENEQLSEKQL